MTLQVVWFKRDLRTFDNEALFRACEAGPTLCLYVIEPDYWQLKDTSNRQWHFIRESLRDLSGRLEALGGCLVVHVGNVLDSLARLKNTHGSFALHSHEETGNLWTFERDKAVTRWCREHRCNWKQYAQNGVFRPVSKRSARFKEHWDQWAAKSMFAEPRQAVFEVDVPGLEPSQWPTDLAEDPYRCLGGQQGGRTHGLAMLDSFAIERSAGYRGSISSPLTAESGCSRLSPYIAYGCLSLREIAQRAAMTQAQAPSQSWRKSLEAFSTRLWWHCYFIQTLENRPSLEDTALVPEMERLHRPFDQEKFDAWRTGNTGWPLVDACMRYLHHHGWVNFRMRAMLVSAATYSLSLPWRPVAHWLARLFVDFEPGIHYPQVQMQSGAAGGAVLRIYNPVTQAKTLDPQGTFVKAWVPALRNTSPTWIFEPWKMTPNLRQQMGLDEEPSYRPPLLDFEAVHRRAKAEITALRAAYELHPAGGFSEQVGKARSSRDKPAPPQADPPAQLGLF